MTLAEIKIALAKLRPEEVDEVIRAATALRQFGITATPAVDRSNPEKEMLLNVLHDTLERFGCPCPFPVLRNAAKGSDFTTKMDVLMKFCDGLTKQERLAVIMLGTTLMVNDLQQNGVMISPGTVIRCIHRIPAAINRAFPNYARQGLLKFISLAMRA